MFSLGLILAYLFLALFGLASTVNYCDPSLCTTNNIVKHHIACKNNGEFRSNCAEPAIIQITKEMRESILFWHNEYRNKVANGSLPEFESAQRMTTVTWDTELEYLAGLNVLTCKLEHDDCHNTFEYKYSGQNLAIQYQSLAISTSKYANITVLLMKEWFNEYMHANQGDVDICTARGLSKSIGHFTAMIQEKSAKIGCGLARFSEVIKGNKWYAILFACNYSFTNMIDMPIYVKGTMASACETGTNPDFNGLCSLAEYVPPIHDLDAVNLPAAQRPAPVMLTVPTPRPMFKPALISSLPPPNPGYSREVRRVPSARMMELMKTAERVVKPYNPNETNFYIKTEPNPEVRGIVRPVPDVTWRGPRITMPGTTMPASTQQGQPPPASHRGQTFYKRDVPNPPVRSNDIIRPVAVLKSNKPATSGPVGSTLYINDEHNPSVRNIEIILPVPDATYQGPSPIAAPRTFYTQNEPVPDATCQRAFPIAAPRTFYTRNEPVPVATWQDSPPIAAPRTFASAATEPDQFLNLRVERNPWPFANFTRL